MNAPGVRIAPFSLEQCTSASVPHLPAASAIPGVSGSAPTPRRAQAWESVIPRSVRSDSTAVRR